jgi:hypothetical protein
MRSAPLLLLLACAVGGVGPATPGSPSADGAAKVAALADQAAHIEALAQQLTAQVDESRRAVEEGRSTPPAEIATMRALMRQIDEENAKLQADLAAVEAGAHAAAGDPAPPTVEKN